MRQQHRQLAKQRQQARLPGGAARRGPVAPVANKGRALLDQARAKMQADRVRGPLAAGVESWLGKGGQCIVMGRCLAWHRPEALHGSSYLPLHTNTLHSYLQSRRGPGSQPASRHGTPETAAASDDQRHVLAAAAAAAGEGEEDEVTSATALAPEAAVAELKG